MGAISFVLPLKPEKIAEGYDFIEQLTGEREGEHHERHKMHGLKKFKIWRQHAPVEGVIVYIEADDVEKMLDSRKNSEHEFEKWFDAQVMNITGHHWAEFDMEPLMDWHSEEGHHHRVKERR